MNIFPLSLRSTVEMNIKETASFMCDKHVVKMINEYTQMLVTALAHSDNITGSSYEDWLLVTAPCKPLSGGHINHPCTIWTRNSTVNFKWLSHMALELTAEHQHRYPMSPEHAYTSWLRKLVASNKTTLAMPPRFPLAIHYLKDLNYEREVDWPAAVELYREYYICEKFHIAKWTRRKMPTWFEEGVSTLYKTAGG